MWGGLWGEPVQNSQQKVAFLSSFLILIDTWFCTSWALLPEVQNTEVISV